MDKETWRGKSGRRQTPNTRQPEANKRPARPRDTPPRPEATLMRLNFFVMDVAGDRHLLRKGDRQEDGKTRWEKYATTQICPRRGHQTTPQPPRRISPPTTGARLVQTAELEPTLFPTESKNARKPPPRQEQPRQSQTGKAKTDQPAPAPPTPRRTGPRQARHGREEPKVQERKETTGPDAIPQDKAHRRRQERTNRPRRPRRHAEPARGKPDTSKKRPERRTKKGKKGQKVASPAKIKGKKKGKRNPTLPYP